MRIAHCIHGVGLGGAQQVVRHIIAAREPGFDYTVLGSMSGVFHEQIEEAGASVHIIPRFLPKFDPIWISRLARAMRREKVDLVHAHLFGDSLHGYLAARRVGLPVILTLHNVVEARTGIQRWGYNWLLGKPLTPIACAEFVRRSFGEHFGDRAAGIRSIQNAVDIPSEQPDPSASRRVFEKELGVRPGATILAGVGRMVHQKAFEHMISAVAGLRSAGTPVQLVLFGEGTLRSRLESQVRNLGLSDDVIFAGFRSDIRQLMAAIDTRASNGRGAYARQVRDECMDKLTELEAGLQALIPPPDLQEKNRELEATVAAGRGAWSDFIAHLEGIQDDQAYDGAAARDKITAIARSWYDYRRIHGQLNDGVREHLED